MMTSRALLSALLIALCSTATATAQMAEAGSALSVAKALLGAFNQHDPAAMASLVAPDFELYYFDEAGQAGLAVRGPDALIEEMTSYFAGRPNVESKITGAIAGPVYVSFREQIVGGQSSLAVYEVRDGLIRRVWYYPVDTE